MAKATTLCNALLEHVLGGTSYTPPATLYLALYTVAPTAAGGGTECAGSGYARVAVPAGSGWSAAAAGAKSNATELLFATAGASWGTAAAFGLLDAPTGGTLLYFADLQAPLAIGSGATARFAPGSLTITES